MPDDRPCDRACCRGFHQSHQPCDPCPFQSAGVEGVLLWKLYAICGEEYTDPKTKVTKYYLDPQRILPAFTIYHITETERAYELLNLAVQALNGTLDRIYPLDDDGEEDEVRADG